MGEVSAILLTEDAAWAVYQRLVKRALDDPRLFADRAHCEAMARAYTAFLHLFDQRAA